MSSICIILCVLAFPLMGGGNCPLRSQYVIPFAFSFICLYVVNSISEYKNKLAYKIYLFLFILCGTKQAFISSMLNYCDVMRYQSDCRLSSELSERISNVCRDSDVPVVFYGGHNPQFSSNYIKGEVCGYSPFEYDEGSSITECTSRGLSFMKTQGYNFNTTSDLELINKARKEAEQMSDFPNEGSVRNLGDIIIVRLSKSSYMID